MSSDPSSKSAAKNGRRFDLRHMKFSVFNTDWVTNERGLFPRGLTTTLNCTLVQKLGHGTFRFDAWTERRVVPDKGMRTHLTISLFSLQGFFCFSFFFSCFVFYLRIFCEIFLRFLFLNTPEYRGLLPFYNAFNIF